MNRYRYLPILFCVILLCCGCGGLAKTENFSQEKSETAIYSRQPSRDSSAVQITVQDEKLIFQYPAIEEKTREILGKPEGVITRKDVLAITEFKLDNVECANPFQDLRWFQNLENISLNNCGIKRLNGVEQLQSLKTLNLFNNSLKDITLVSGLTNLTKLQVNSNAIEDISPVSELTNLIELGVDYNAIEDISPIGGLTNLIMFSCRGNPISDYTPLQSLTHLEKLYMGANDSCDINLEVIAGLTKLRHLYIPNSEISDISALKDLTELEYLNLYNNHIKDISVLKNLKKLQKLDLEENEITDITPLYSLDKLIHISLKNNNIPDEEFTRFYEEKRITGYTVTITDRLQEDMPEFTFCLAADFNLYLETFELQTLTVYEGETKLQTISIPEMTSFGQTVIYDSMADTLGFSLEDLNFDGYQDIRLFDAPNGNYLVESIYLVWNPEKRQFEEDARLNAIPLASFDQEKQLIYGMERGGAVYHYYSTYQYIDGELVKIRYEEEEGVFFGDAKSEEFRVAASGKDEAAFYSGSWLYVHVMERNGDTGELETVSEEYVFSQLQEDGREIRRICVDIASKLGQQMKAAEQ